MIEQIKLGKERFLLLRAISACAAFASTCVCFLLALIGFIPFRGKPMPLLPSINSIFEVVNIGIKPFWYCVSCIAFSALYIFLLIKAGIAIVISIKQLPKCVTSKMDGSQTRMETKRIVAHSNTILGIFVCLYATSFVMSKFTISTKSALVLILLITVNVIINAISLLFLTENIPCSISYAITRGTTLASILILSLMHPHVQIFEIFRSLNLQFSAIGTNSAMGKFVVQSLSQQVLLPLFYLIALTSAMRFYFNISTNYVTCVSISKNSLIRNSIFLAILVFSIGYASNYSTLGKYLAITLENGIFILVTAIIFIGAILLNPPAPEIPSYDPPPQESAVEPEKSTTDDSTDLTPDETE